MARNAMDANMSMSPQQKRENLRMALILASVAAVFFIGVVVKMVWMAS
jgi:hypothetical protein